MRNARIQFKIMADHCPIVFACVLSILIVQAFSQNDFVPFTPITDVAKKGAVCIDGTPAGYSYAPGSGEGVNNWLIFLLGGGWCWQNTCVYRAGKFNGGTKNIITQYFAGILSSKPEINPDFHNWNRVLVRYCDGGSFLGDIERDDMGIKVQLRGSRIFNAVMDELLQKGLKNANNAILAGTSAGGLATMLHCDGFRSLVPSASRVKCLSDGGFFVLAEDIPFVNTRKWVYDQTVQFHNLTDFLPKSCTSKMNPSLCLFPEFLVEDIQTPLFLLNSAFDQFQLHDNMVKYPDGPSWDRCTRTDIDSCTPDQKQRIQDFHKAFLHTVSQIADNPSRGWFINSCFIHGMMDLDAVWNAQEFGVENTTIAQAFADWYFDRKPIYTWNGIEQADKSQMF